MIYSLFFWSVFFILLGLYFFWKKKPLLGWLFLLVGLMALTVGFAVVTFFPEKL